RALLIGVRRSAKREGGQTATRNCVPRTPLYALSLAASWFDCAHHALRIVEGHHSLRTRGRVPRTSFCSAATFFLRSQIFFLPSQISSLRSEIAFLRSEIASRRSELTGRRSGVSPDSVGRRFLRACA